MSNLVALKRPPSDLAEHLRAMADLVDAGEITDMVMAYHHNDERRFTYGSSLNNSLILSTLLQTECIKRMYA